MTTLVSGVIRAFTGFGAALLMAPVFSMFMLPVDAIAIILLLNFITTLQMLPDAIRNVRWKPLFSLMFPAMASIPLGVLLLTSVDPALMRRFIALIVVALTLILLLGWRYRGQRGLLPDVAVGLSSGILTGTTSMGGPPVILYLLSGSGRPTENRATFVLFFGVSQFSALASLFLNDMLTTEHAVGTAWLLPVYLFATWIGVRCYRAISGRWERLLRKASLVVLLAIGVIALVI
jgi:hypothetical protein